MHGARAVRLPQVSGATVSGRDKVRAAIERFMVNAVSTMAHEDGMGPMPEAARAVLQKSAKELTGMLSDRHVAALAALSDEDLAKVIETELAATARAAVAGMRPS